MGEITNTAITKRRGNPLWKAGQSGNPNGRPKIAAEFREIAQSKTSEALATVVQIMDSEDSKDSDRLRAAELVLAYGLGKPIQSIDIAEEKVFVITMDDALDDLAE